MSARHNGGAYFKPHHKSRLAFVEECVMIWYDDRTPYLDDPDNVAAVKSSIRKDVVARLGSNHPDVEHFIAMEYGAFKNELIARELCDHIELLTKPRPKKGNVRRHTPKHLPLRPSRAIVAVQAIWQRGRDPSASINAIYNQVAEHFNDGIPRSEADGRLTNRSVRSACEGFGHFDPPEVMLEKHRRAVDRFFEFGPAHVWDWTFYDAVVWARQFEHRFGRQGDDWVWRMTHLSRDLLLVSFERLYQAARAGKRFAGFAGVDLARAVDAHIGVRSWTISDMNALAPLIPSAEGRTASAGR